MTSKTTETELYEYLPDTEDPYPKWYVSFKKTEREDCTFYTIETGNCEDGRSKSRIQINEEELPILMRLMKEMTKEEKA